LSSMIFFLLMTSVCFRFRFRTFYGF
jgi:hypothetical protein